MGKLSVAVAHLHPGDHIINGVGPLVPAGTVKDVEMRRTGDVPGPHRSYEASGSHVRIIHYADGGSSEPVNGSRHVGIERA